MDDEASEVPVTQSPPSPASPLFDEDLLLAVSTAPELPRPAACRLAAAWPAWRHTPTAERLGRFWGLSEQLAEHALRVRREAPQRAAREREHAAAVGAQVLTRMSPGYPARLLCLSLPPAVLYVAGELPTGPGVTVVGARRADAYGLEVAELFSRELARAGAVVISGFARGIDAAAHRGALADPEGRTVAVLGCGLGVDYPRGQGRLAAEIAERGALVSEFPPGTPPASWQFPVRNRVLAALGQAALVVRATERSGSLVTAKLALDLGRDLYAVPGRLFEAGSMGPNALLLAGAIPALHPSLILAGLDPPLAAAPSSPPVAMPEGPGGRLIAHLPPGEAVAAEDLAEATGLPLGEVAALLLELELTEQVRRLPGGLFRRPLALAEPLL
ncbi:MAG TPA: DNA-processing protein DprA [Thermoanaerobaculia bacterium]|nr:DNA-processing protein DprA [Thermoanaerobaculia bacterium]